MPGSGIQHTKKVSFFSKVSNILLQLQSMTRHLVHSSNIITEHLVVSDAPFWMGGGTAKC